MIKIIYCIIYQSQEKTVRKQPSPYIINSNLLNNTTEEHGFSDNSTSVPRKNREMLGIGWKNKKSFIFPDKITWVSEIQD